LNRSLPGLTAQACSRKSVSCSSVRRAEFFYSVASCMTGHFICVRSLPLRRAVYFFFACCRSAGPVRARIFFCGVRSGVHAESFFWVCMQSPVASCLRAQIFFYLCCPVNSRGVHAGIFFVLSGQQQGCACRNFFLFCPVTSSLLGARSFFGRSCSARAPCMRVRGANFFCPVASSSCAYIFFQPHSTAVCVVFCFCVWSLSAVLTARALTFL
jgi:hypothetical protein